jgi:hypothetical protein
VRTGREAGLPCPVAGRRSADRFQYGHTVTKLNPAAARQPWRTQDGLSDFTGSGG